MPTVSTPSILAGTALLLSAIGASAAPISSCSANTGQAGFTCSIFESNANGGISEVSNTVTLPSGVTGGYVIVLERPNGSIDNSADWSDVLAFGNGTSDVTTQVQLWSDTGFTPAFINMVLNSTSKTSIVETQMGTGDDFTDFSTYTAPVAGGQNIYKIFSAAPVNEGEMVPEPATMALLGSGLLGILAIARRRSR